MSERESPLPAECNGWIDIENHDELYRFITDDQIGPDGKPDSGAFSGGTGFISIDIAKATTPDMSVERLGKAGVKLAVFLASVPRAHEQEPTHCPLEGFESHAELRGERPKISRGVRRQIAANCYVMPGVVSKGAKT